MSRAGLGCQRPDCDGTYEDVGGGELSCDICGPAPVVSADGPTCSVPTVAAAVLAIECAFASEAIGAVMDRTDISSL